MLAKTLIASILALQATAAPVVILMARQGAGTGSALDSLFSDTDTGSGLFVEEAEDNTAQLIGGAKGTNTGTATGSGGAAPPAPPPKKRQANKWTAGADTLISAAGAPQVGDIVGTDGNTVDGQGTDDQAELGAQAGGDEETALAQAGNLVPRK